jgi:sulfite dehydrogenase (quinone) subunit SoeC
MNPTFSVILLTTASGAGYGMLAWLGVLNALRLLPASPMFGVASIFVALVLSAIGMVASLFHLGRPERAWRAVSQWRTSWLSREGVLALLTILPTIGFAAAWWSVGPVVGVTVGFGLLAAACGLATVACQAMIYATLRPVRQWCHHLVPPNFLLLSLYSGAVWLAAAVALDDAVAARLLVMIALVCAIGAAVVKLAYWREIDTSAPVATIESATGLGWLGPVRSLDPPHTEENFLLREMGYVIAREHASRLRRIATVAGFVVPLVLLIAAALVGGLAGVAALFIAAVLVVSGIYVERWLFFAEATHTVTLYYER